MAKTARLEAIEQALQALGIQITAAELQNALKDLSPSTPRQRKRKQYTLKDLLSFPNDFKISLNDDVPYEVLEYFYNKSPEYFALAFRINRRRPRKAEKETATIEYV